MIEAKPTWIKIKPEELKKLVLDLSKKGETPAKIGLILRDKHGIPKSKLLGKKITQILKESNIKYKDEEKMTQEKLKQLRTHLEKNKHDYPAQRSLTKNLWALHRLTKSE